MHVIPESAAPIRIRRLKDDTGGGIGLEISWSTGEEAVLSSELLRKFCPCAACVEERGAEVHANPLGAPRKGRAMLQVIKATAAEGLDLREMWSVGNYAVGIRWGDGHDSGIFSYPIFRALSERVLSSGVNTLQENG